MFVCFSKHFLQWFLWWWLLVISLFQRRRTWIMAIYLCELLTQPFLDSRSILFWLTMAKQHILLHLDDLFNGRKLTKIVFMSLTPVFCAAILKVQSIVVQWKIMDSNLKKKTKKIYIYNRDSSWLHHYFQICDYNLLPIQLTYQHSFVVIL